MGTAAYDRLVGAVMRGGTVVHRGVDRVSAGRWGRRLGPVPAVWLTTTGRRSGQPRRTPLVAARDGDGSDAPYLVAASAGGREEAPAWSHNLRAHAERAEPARLQAGDAHLVVEVEELHGAERDRCYAAMVRLASNFASYEQHATRTIPVFRLTPRRRGGPRRAPR